jgi:predicted small secreted protein
MKLFILVTSLMFLLSCSNTWEGIKKDSKDVGEAVGEAAEKAGKSIKEALE